MAVRRIRSAVHVGAVRDVDHLDHHRAVRDAEHHPVSRRGSRASGPKVNSMQADATFSGSRRRSRAARAVILGLVGPAGHRRNSALMSSGSTNLPESASASPSRITSSAPGRTRRRQDLDGLLECGQIVGWDEDARRTAVAHDRHAVVGSFDPGHHSESRSRASPSGIAVMPLSIARVTGRTAPARYHEDVPRSSATPSLRPALPCPSAEA